jgi:hypothetical protein
MSVVASKRCLSSRPHGPRSRERAGGDPAGSQAPSIGPIESGAANLLRGHQASDLDGIRAPAGYNAKAASNWMGKQKQRKPTNTNMGAGDFTGSVQEPVRSGQRARNQGIHHAAGDVAM